MNLKLKRLANDSSSSNTSIRILSVRLGTEPRVSTGTVTNVSILSELFEY